jgi:hypothetical protein
MTEADRMVFFAARDICKALDAAREAGEGAGIVPHTLEKIVTTVLLVTMEPGNDDELIDLLARHVKEALRTARSLGEEMFSEALH